MKNIWHIIESHSLSPASVIKGTHLLERFFHMRMRSIIQPSDYRRTIATYLQWQLQTVRSFTEQYQQHPRTDRLNAIEHLWNWNHRDKEAMFFGGAARPLHLKTVTEFSALMSIYYDSLWPVFKDKRHTLAEALNDLLREECRIYWPEYEIFPCNGSTTIVDKCLQYFFFRDRQNTWFINSSASDYIPFVHSARGIFAERFIGSTMPSPEQHNTEWILRDLIKRCSKIDDGDLVKPTIVILLTSKNRFGHRIDVDLIHRELTGRFRDVFTLVDACQDGQAFTDVDIIVYTKRFTTTGALGLVSRAFLEKNAPLSKKLTVSTSFPISILAQLYINMNMVNADLVHGVDELVNSSWWHHWHCPMRSELHSAMEFSYMEQYAAEFNDDPIRYIFTEDLTGTIVMIKARNDGHKWLSKLWALLRKQGHSLDCFVMDNIYLKSSNGIVSDHIRELINGKFIEKLRQVEVLSSDYLTWPLVPYWVSSPDDITVEELEDHFHTSYTYHCCLRLSLGRCGYPGKLKRLVQHIRDIFQSNALDVSDDVLGKHSSQWVS